jgi:23S rRNA (cytidine1920-2'-O)/16S rRNA (cytidine1409-2'-O)-methyltransferase
MRIDVYITECGLAESRNKAQRLIESGTVFLDGKLIKKPSYEVDGTEHITICGSGMPYVGRGGLKLEAALDAFAVDVTGMIATDIGASTGGFTDCLLKRGAKKVFAVDSGINQLHKSLVSDSRVVLMEKTNARCLTAEMLGDLCDIAVMDVSFISQTLLYGTVNDILKDNGIFISLIKPQFEAGRMHVGKNGIVRDISVHASLIKRLIGTAASYGLFCTGAIRSPVDGGDGNREYLAIFTKGKSSIITDDRYINKIVYG